MNKKKIIDWTVITLGVFIMMFGFSFFLSPLSMVTGGFMGIIVLLRPLIEGTFITQSMIALVMNVTALIIGGLLLGKQFFLRTCYATLLSPLFVFIFEFADPMLILNHIPESARLLIGSLFGGAFVGLGIGLVIRYNATTGGMDVVQRIINKYAKIPFSIALYLTDGLVILIGMFVGFYQGFFANGFFGILSMIVSALAIERIAVFGRTSFTVLIVTDHPEAIKQAIYDSVNRGITRIKVVGGYSNQEKEMVMCTLYRQQIYMLKEVVLKTDPQAFTLVLNTKQVVGYGFSGDDLT